MSTEKLNLVIGAKDKASGVLNKLKGTIIGVGAAYLGWRSAKALIGDIVQKGMESERVWNQVEASLSRHNLSVKDNIASVMKFGSTMQSLTGISDEVIGQSIQTLLDYGNSIKTSYDLVKVSADLAVGGHMDMRAAIDLVGKASVGYTGTLSRYGIIIDESIPKTEKFAKAIEQINQRFGGAAQEEMKTITGLWNRLKETYGDFLEKIFETEGTREVIAGIMSWLTTWFESLPALIGSSIESIKVWGRTFIETFESVGFVADSFADLIDAVMRFDYDRAIANLAVFEFQVEAGMKAMAENITLATIQSTETLLLAVKANADAIDGAITAAKNITEERVEEINKTLNQIKIDSDEFIDEDEYSEALSQMVKLNEDTAKRIRDVRRRMSVEELAIHDVNMRRQLQGRKALSATEVKVVTSAAQSITASMNNATNGIVNGLMRGKVEVGEIWKQMAADFVSYFVQQILQMAAGPLVGGLIKILGSIFDNPHNDAIAALMGKHYAQHLTRGALDELGRSSIGPNIAMASAPTYSGGSEPTGGTVYNVYSMGLPGTIQTLRTVIRGAEYYADRGATRLQTSAPMLTMQVG